MRQKRQVTIRVSVFQPGRSNMYISASEKNILANFWQPSRKETTCDNAMGSRWTRHKYILMT